MEYIKNYVSDSFKSYGPQVVNIWTTQLLKELSLELNLSENFVMTKVKEQEEKMRRGDTFDTLLDNSDERKALRETTVNDYMSYFGTEKKEGKATIIIGKIASGKSTLAEKIRDTGGAMIIDVYIIKTGKNNFNGLKLDYAKGKGSEKVHNEASFISKQIISKVAKEKQNIILPKVGADITKIKQICELLKNYNYKIDLIFLDVSMKTCMKRNFYRFLNCLINGENPILVPINKITKTDNMPFKTFCKLYNEVSNQIKTGQSPLIDNFEAFSNETNLSGNLTPIDISSIGEAHTPEKLIDKQFRSNVDYLTNEEESLSMQLNVAEIMKIYENIKVVIEQVKCAKKKTSAEILNRIEQEELRRNKLITPAL